MKLSTILNITPALPDWRVDDARLKEPAAAVGAAQRAIDDADARLDRASALVLAIDADLAAATSSKQANALEDRRDAALQEEADAKKALERGMRALDRATKSHEPLELAAQRDCAKALRAIYVEKIAVVARMLEQLKDAAAVVEAVADHARAVLPEQEYPFSSGVATGVLRRDVAQVWNEPPILAVPKLLEKIAGRRGASIDHFLARLRELRLL